MATVTPFVYNAILERVVDGDTIDVLLTWDSMSFCINNAAGWQV